MTRQFNQQFHCPNCKTWQTQETLFGRWIRNNKALDSSQGYCVTDQDYIIHKFKTFEGRDFQLIIMVEIKVMGADLSEAQRDTLHIWDQLIRNRRQTPTKKLRNQLTSTIPVRSVKNERLVKVRSYGVHVLRFSGLGPEDSEWIKWDKKDITLAQLTALLRFDLDPDTLKPIDLRNHHVVRSDVIQSLFDEKEMA